MKTRYRHIFFKLCGDDLWHCFSTHDTGLELGFVEYYQQWKQFQFVPSIVHLLNHCKILEAVRKKGMVLIVVAAWISL